MSLFILAPIAFQDEPLHPIKELSFERTQCFGTCPGYKVTIKNDGTVHYHGEAFVARRGDYTAKLWQGCLESLAEAYDKLGYWSLKRSYSVNFTDQSSQILIVTSDKGKKTVSEYGHHGPTELWTCQMLVDGLLWQARDWKKVKT
jgi:hypothetical protein